MTRYFMIVLKVEVQYQFWSHVHSGPCVRKEYLRKEEEDVSYSREDPRIEEYWIVFSFFFSVNNCLGEREGTEVGLPFCRNLSSCSEGQSHQCLEMIQKAVADDTKSTSFPVLSALLYRCSCASTNIYGAAVCQFKELIGFLIMIIKRVFMKSE